MSGPAVILHEGERYLSLAALARMLNDRQFLASSAALLKVGIEKGEPLLRVVQITLANLPATVSGDVPLGGHFTPADLDRIAKGLDRSIGDVVAAALREHGGN